MRTVFEPSNALEGYMLQDLLKQRGIASRMDGAQLQGGVGELPVSGLVRLVVDDEDFEAARGAIDEWEATTITEPIPASPSRTSKGVLGALVGLALGIAGTYALFRVPMPVDGIDHNDDGSLDERWFTSASGMLVKTEVDRDFDDSVDLIHRYNSKGEIESSAADDDFDGIFETKWSYIRGNAAYGEVDSDGDSSVDLILRLRHGVLYSTEYYLVGMARPVRTEYFHLGRMTTAEVDTNRDGVLDTRYKYSSAAEIIETESIESQR